MLCRLDRIHPGSVCFAKLTLLLYKNQAEEQALQDLFVRAGWDRRSSTKAASAQGGLNLDPFCYDKYLGVCKCLYHRYLWAMPWWGLGCNGVSPFKGYGGFIDLAVNALALGASGKNAPGLRTTYGCRGLFCSVADCRIGHWVVGFICSCFQTQGCATQKSVGVCIGRSYAAAV